MQNTGKVYIGIDLSAKSALVSIYQKNMEEPQTVSTVLGSQNFTIPTFLAKKLGMSQWYFGDEALSMVRTRRAEAVEDIYNAALRDEDLRIDGESYQAKDLMVIFFKKLFSIPGPREAFESLEKLTVCVEQVNLEVMELMTYVTMKLGIDLSRLMLIDRRESFYYYALSQKPDLFLYNVALFDYGGTNMVSCVLRRNQGTRPQVINLDVVNHGGLSENRDLEFDGIIADTFGSQIFSSVYLVGDGFDGDWMKTSLSRICRGRKVFLGKNLYSKGACYAGYIKDENTDWPFIYIGDNDLKLNLSIKTLDENEMKFFTLIDAGVSWYEASGECEVILDGAPEIEFYIQRPESREAHVEVLELSDIPARENRTTRLRILAHPISDVAVSITIVDLGFGDISPSSGKTWEHIISIG